VTEERQPLRVFSGPPKAFLDLWTFEKYGVPTRSPSALVLGRGRVAENYGYRAASIVRTRVAWVRVDWLGDVFPPGVVVGAHVAWLGVYTSGNAGRIVRVTRALALRKEAWKQASGMFEELCRTHCIQPREYITQELYEAMEAAHGEPTAHLRA
jgi:hypothetical protein